MVVTGNHRCNNTALLKLLSLPHSILWFHICRLSWTARRARRSWSSFHATSCSSASSRPPARLSPTSGLIWVWPPCECSHRIRSHHEVTLACSKTRTRRRQSALLHHPSAPLLILLESTDSALAVNGKFNNYKLKSLQTLLSTYKLCRQLFWSCPCQDKIQKENIGLILSGPLAGLWFYN